LLNKFIPNSRAESIYGIALQDLWNQGIRGIIADLDNTLVGAGVANATPELLKWLEQISNLGFQLVIVSNNNATRVGRFANPLNLPFIHRARKPTKVAFRQALQLMELSANQVAVIGDQMLTDVLGGNRLGLHTILVLPIALNEESFFTRLNRKLETIVRLLTKHK